MSPGASDRLSRSGDEGGVDPFTEGAVGDFALGGLPTGEYLAGERDQAQRHVRWEGARPRNGARSRRSVITGARTGRTLGEGPL